MKATSAHAANNPSRARARLVLPVSADNSKRALLIGVTGKTGRSALAGLLASGVESSRLTAITRNSKGTSALEIANLGVNVLECDLDKYDQVESVLHGFDTIYCHALSTDARSADPHELERARNVARASKSGAKHVIYHSSGGKGCGYGISQMEQKHAVEDILSESVSLTALQVTFLMEELWKRYTRPSILKGTFPFSVPGTTSIQLFSAYDLGRVLSVVLTKPEVFRGRSIELASDELTPLEMCDAFAEAQGAPVRHQCPPAWPFWFLARDVYRIVRFLKERGYNADLAECRRLFPGLLSFRDFLHVSGWKEAAKSYEDGIQYNVGSLGIGPMAEAVAETGTD